MSTKDRISQLMDGELDDRSAAEVFETLRQDREAVQTWRTYQLISDALRESRVLSTDFTARFSERLAAEPTVFAPRAHFPGVQPASRRWYVASAAAASFAAVAMVGWLAFAPQPQVAHTTWLHFALNPFPDLFAMPPGGVCVKVKDALLKRRLTDDQIGVAYDYLTRADHDVMGGMLGLATYGGRVNTVAPDATASAHRAADRTRARRRSPAPG